MKILKQLFTLAAIALLMTACNKNDELAPEQDSTFPADGIIRVATSVAQPQTRAGMTIEDIYKFQLHIVNDNNSAYSYNALMYKDGPEWASFRGVGKGPITLLWQNKTQPVKVSAVVNMLEEIKDDEWNWGKLCDVYILSDQQSSYDLKRSDILIMTERMIDPSKDLVDEKIPITLKHSFSKLNITVKLGTEFNKLEFGGTDRNSVYNVKVGGTNTKARWMIATDSLMSRKDRMDIIPMNLYEEYIAGSGDTKQAEAFYECILLPQIVEANKFVVSFKITNRSFSWTSPVEVKLHSDTQYNLTLNVGKDVVTVGGFTTTAWTEADEQNIETE